MTSEDPPLFLSWDIEQSAASIHRACDDKVSSVMVTHRVNRLAVTCEGSSTLDLDKVPDLHSSVTRAGSKICSCRVEVQASDPVLVAFTLYDHVTFLNLPNLPAVISSSCCHERFSRMDCYARHTQIMSFEVLRDVRVLRWERLEGCRQERVCHFIFADLRRAGHVRFSCVFCLCGLTHCV